MTLDEPSLSEQRILKALNLTVQDFYREATFKLNRDFKLYMSKNEYGLGGDKIFKIELDEGKSNVNSFQVNTLQIFKSHFISIIFIDISHIQFKCSSNEK